MHPQYYRRHDLPQNVEDVDSFRLYHGTEAVVIVYGNARLSADEHNHAGRILKTLDWLGKEGIPIRGMFRAYSYLCPSSVRALNLYLKYGHGLTAFRRANDRFYPFDKHGWKDLQSLLNFRWSS